MIVCEYYNKGFKIIEIEDNDTFRIVRDRYLNGEITKETIEQISNENKSRKTLEKILGCTKTLKREELFK